jgi:short-subunit dehydrogenase
MTLRVVILGATSAIAQAVGRRYAEQGAVFFLVARDAARLNAVAADFTARGATAVSVLARDLADCRLHEDVVALSRQALGGLDCVLLAYGVLPDQKACEQDAAAVVASLQTNYVSAVSLLTSLANVMEAQGHGTIGVIGSVAGDRGRQSNYVYGSAKGGLAVFVQGLRHRLIGKGVRVVLIKPGFVTTPMTAQLAKDGPLWASPQRVADDILRALGKGTATLYTPWFWRIIMAIVKLVPDALFSRMRL